MVLGHSHHNMDIGMKDYFTFYVREMHMQHLHCKERDPVAYHHSPEIWQIYSSTYTQSPKLFFFCQITPVHRNIQFHHN